MNYTSKTHNEVIKSLGFRPPVTVESDSSVPHVLSCPLGPTFLVFRRRLFLGLLGILSFFRIRFFKILGKSWSPKFSKIGLLVFQGFLHKLFWSQRWSLGHHRLGNTFVTPCLLPWCRSFQITLTSPHMATASWVTPSAVSSTMIFIFSTAVNSFPRSFSRSSLWQPCSVGHRFS